MLEKHIERILRKNYIPTAEDYNVLENFNDFFSQTIHAFQAYYKNLPDDPMDYENNTNSQLFSEPQAFLQDWHFRLKNSDEAFLQNQEAQLWIERISQLSLIFKVLTESAPNYQNFIRNFLENLYKLELLEILAKKNDHYLFSIHDPISDIEKELNENEYKIIKEKYLKNCILAFKLENYIPNNSEEVNLSNIDQIEDKYIRQFANDNDIVFSDNASARSHFGLDIYDSEIESNFNYINEYYTQLRQNLHESDYQTEYPDETDERNDVVRILSLSYLPDEKDYNNILSSEYNFNIFYKRTLEQFLLSYNNFLKYESIDKGKWESPIPAIEDLQKLIRAEDNTFSVFLDTVHGSIWKYRLENLFLIRSVLDSINNFDNPSFEKFKEHYAIKLDTCNLLLICDQYYPGHKFSLQNDNIEITTFLVSKNNVVVNESLRYFDLLPRELQSNQDHLFNQQKNPWFALKIIAALIAATLLLVLSLAALAPMIAALGFAVGPGLAMIAGLSALLTVSTTAATGIILGLGTLLAVSAGVVGGVTMGVVAAQGFFGQKDHWGDNGRIGDIRYS